MAEPLIRVDELNKQHRRGGLKVHALRGITLEIHEGEFVAVIGPSGSGKSTLMHLLGLLDHPTSGSYFLGGRNVTDLDPDQRAHIRNRDISFVFQSFNLLGRSTAIENVEVPLIYAGKAKRERQQRAAAALAMVGLSSRQDHWPGQLSGGEQQRVAIARALACDPRLLLADEPTGSLDSRTSCEIMLLLQALNQAGRTIILVTHDPTIAQYAQRIIAMQDGRVVRDGRVAKPLQAHADTTGSCEPTQESEGVLSEISA